MKLALSILSIALLSAVMTPTTAAQDALATIKRTPRIVIPDAVRKMGIGGELRVFVKVDTEGKVESVERVHGPGFVCDQVTRVEIIEVRNAAREAAKKAKFEPVATNGL